MSLSITDVLKPNQSSRLSVFTCNCGLKMEIGDFEDKPICLPCTYGNFFSCFDCKQPLTTKNKRDWSCEKCK